MSSIPRFVVGIVAGLIFSAFISSQIWESVDSAFVCNELSEQGNNACMITKRILWMVLFIGPPSAGFMYGLKSGRR